ncbi:MAG: hypothetical protein HZY76_03380 [Anaerolineae bacterium]|nr:MAG: hypothetical protein HZY76_03380 [Anaerolineae bacterium]
MLTPTAGTLLPTLGVVTIEGAASSHDYLKQVTITVDGSPAQVIDWPAGVTRDTAWNWNWTPPAAGVYLLSAFAEDWSGRVQTDTTPITLTVSTTPPAIAIDNVVFTEVNEIASNQVRLKGPASAAAAAVVAVETGAGPVLCRPPSTAAAGPTTGSRPTAPTGSPTRSRRASPMPPAR